MTKKNLSSSNGKPKTPKLNPLTTTTATKNTAVKKNNAGLDRGFIFKWF